MALAKNFRPYEALFRFNDDGTVAAHVQHIKEIWDNGTFESGTIQNAIPLALAGPEFDAVIAAINQAAFAERDALTIERDGLVIERDGLATERSALTVERDALIVTRDDVIVERNTLTTERGTLEAERDDLVIERDALKTERDDLVAAANAARNP